MKCSKCGAELLKGTKFCAYCGERTEMETTAPVEMAVNDSNIEEAVTETTTIPTHEKKTLVDKAKDKFLRFWHRSDLFCKIEIIVMTVVALLLVVAICNEKVIAIFFSVLQLGGLIVALLLHNGKIKCNKKWLKHLVLAFAIIITALNISSYSWFDGIGSNEQIFDTFVKVDIPYSAADCVGKDKDTVRNDFSLSGFSNISEEVIEDLEITETDKYGLVESVSINEMTDFEGNKKVKSSSEVVIKYHSYKRVSIPLSAEEAKSMDIESILKAFEEAGFVDITTDEEYNLDPDTTMVDFENRISIDGISLLEKDVKIPLNADIRIVTHRPYEKYTLKVVVDFIPNLLFSTYDVKFEIDNYTETLTHGKDVEFEYRLKQGKYTLSFKSTESSSVKGTVEIDLTGDTEAAYKISCHSDKVSVETEYVENKGAVGENEAMIPASALDCKYENYKDIEKVFKNAGFTNIKTEILYDIVLGWTNEGEVEKVSINGETDFQRGDVFAKDAAIVITYHMKEEDDPNKKEETKPDTSTSEMSSSVFYSTNDYENAQKGNTGVFSYKNKSGSYDVYWIIDFDEGYVFFFTEGNDDTTCDKVKIVSGHLNDKITVTWHDGEEQWSWYLHFKYANSPVTLIVNDHNGFATEFTTTDLDEALGIRDTKTIKEY